MSASTLIPAASGPAAAEARTGGRAALRSALAPGPSYWLVCAALFGVPVAFYCASPLGYEWAARDIWHHVAVLRELMAAPFDPANPHVPTEEGSRYFTPTALVAALIGRVLTDDPVAVLGWVGAANCAALCVGARSVARRLYAHPYAPHVLLCTLLLLWGAQDGFTGQYSLAAFAFAASYPAAQGFVFGLFLWALVLSQLSGGGDRRPAVPLRAVCGTAALTALLVLTHQLTGAIMLAGAGSFVLFRGEASVRYRACLVAALGGGVLSTLLWPYFDPWTVTSSVSDERWRSTVGVMNTVGYQFGLAWPALILGPIGLLHAKGTRASLLLPIMVMSVGWAAMTMADHPIAARLSAAAMLYLHLASVFALLAAQRGELRVPGRFVILAFAVGLMLVSAVRVTATRANEYVFRNGQDGLLRVAREASLIVPEDAVAFATEHAVYPYQSTGRRVVSIPRPEPAAPSLPARQRATIRFFAPQTTAEERDALLAEWDAGYVVIRTFDLPPEVVRDIAALGTATRLDHDLLVVAVTE